MPSYVRHLPLSRRLGKMRFVRTRGTLRICLGLFERPEGQRHQERLLFWPAANWRRIYLPHDELCKRATANHENNGRESVSGEPEKGKRQEHLSANTLTFPFSRVAYPGLRSVREARQCIYLFLNFLFSIAG